MICSDILEFFYSQPRIAAGKEGDYFVIDKAAVFETAPSVALIVAVVFAVTLVVVILNVPLV